ncbi:MAG: hypothetical protein J6X44_02910 [Thermoguttaceae bacterium]|nr:hypothetical protein [Thermoguttaceae bacterium]
MNASLRRFLDLFKKHPAERPQSSQDYQKLRIESLEDRSLLTALGLSIIDGSASEGTTADYASWAVSRSDSTNDPCIIYFQLSGRASYNTDYRLYTSQGSQVYANNNNQGSLTINAGSSTVFLQVQPVNDGAKEPQETVYIQLTGFSCGQESGSTSILGEIAIEDNDNWEVSITASDATATEGLPVDNGVYTIMRSNETDATYPLSVKFQVSGTAGVTADYVLYSSSGSSVSISSQTHMGSVEIPSGSTSTSIILIPTNDTNKEATESATLTLQLAANGAEYGAGVYAISETTSYATVQIADNDDWTVSVVATDDTASERNVNNTGEFTITRYGEVDYSTPLDVQIEMSGARTSGNYWLNTTTGSGVFLSPYQVNQTTTVYRGSVTIPANSYNVRILLHPYDDSHAEVAADATMMILPSSNYTISSTNNSAYVEIEDNDLWKINVTASDDIAKERLQGVVQDYGVYTFTKAYSEENVEGDDSYGITIIFDLIDKAVDHTFKATPRTDFHLNAPANANDGYVYLQNFYYVGKFEVQKEGEGKFDHYRYQGTIPAGETSASVRLEAIFDWLDEAYSYDFDNLHDPGTQEGEFARLEIHSVLWDDNETWDAIGQNKTSEIEIKDGAVCKLRTDSNNNGTLDIFDDVAKKVNGNAGRLFMVNDDNDNNNYDSLNLEFKDNLERPADFNTPHNRTGGQFVTVANENDLALTKAYAWIDSLTPVPGGSSIEIDVYLTGPQEFVVWTAATKGSRVHYGADVDNDNRMDYETTLTTLTESNLVYNNTFYVEANTLRPTNGNASGDILLHTKTIGIQSEGFDDVRFTPVVVSCTDMAFNHNPGISSDGAMNLRQNGSSNTEIIAPEWSTSADSTLGNDGNKNGLAVLYLPNQEVEVYARLTSANIPAGTEVAIRANGKTADGTPLSIGNLDELTFQVQNDGTLLPYNDSTLLSDFVKSINGIDNFVKFTTTGSTAATVNYENATFEWQITQIGGNITGSNKFTVAQNIKLFTVLANPSGTTTANSPWNVVDTSEDDKKMPWVSVLDYACQWANNCATQDSAIGNITQHAYTDFEKEYDFTYHHVAYATTCELSELLIAEYVDCQDMSAVVQLFSQIVGVANVQVRTIESATNNEFVYRSIKPIGKTEWETGTWSFHQFVWYESTIYSACELIRDSENNPTQAIGMSVSDYLGYLLYSGLICITDPYAITNFY